MLRLKYTLTLILLSGVCLGNAAFAAQSDDETAILKIEQDMTAAQTAAAITATWDKNVVFDDMLAPGEIVGLKAVRDNLDRQFAAISNLKAKILRIQVKADDKLGFAFSTQHFTADLKGGKPPMDIVFRETDCFVKKGGSWKLVHQQLSVPFDPATGKAVFDTK